MLICSAQGWPSFSVGPGDARDRCDGTRVGVFDVAFAHKKAALAGRLFLMAQGAQGAHGVQGLMYSDTTFHLPSLICDRRERSLPKRFLGP